MRDCQTSTSSNRTGGARDRRHWRLYTIPELYPPTVKHALTSQRRNAQPKAMDGRSISSRYDFSESETGSIHSGQGRTARTVSLAKRYVSTVSLFSLIKKDSLRKRGNGVRSAASELFLREKLTTADGSVGSRPKTSYLFSLGKESDGLVEIIPQTLVDHEEYDFKRDGLVEVVPASPEVYVNDDVEAITPAGSISFNQWRHSALLPLPGGQPKERPGTCASSVYSEDVGLETVHDDASSTHSRRSEDSGGPRSTGKRLLRTESLLSLAKRYSSHDDEDFMYGLEERKSPKAISTTPNAAVQDDDWSVYSREERAVSPRRRPSTRAGRTSATISPLTPTKDRDSWNLTSLPPLPSAHSQQTWPLPSPTEDQTKDAASRIWWRRSSNFSQNSAEKPERMSPQHELVVRSHNQDATLGRRPSSWSWLTINTIRSDRTSSEGDRKSSETSVLGGHRYIRASVRASTESDASSATGVSEERMSSPTVNSRIYRGPHRLSKGNRPVVDSTEVPDFFHIDGWRAPKRDLLQLPPMQLPELPDEQKVSFYVRCGHFETDPELVATGRELQGWCLECSKARRSKRRIVKRDLKSMLKLKSIAE